MRIATWNINGIRAAIKKGWDEHIARVDPSVLLLQEVRALPEQIPTDWRDPEDWNTLWHPAEKRGYAGTGILAKDTIKEESRGAGEDEDLEGRVVVARVGPVRVASIYLPSGSSGEHRQEIKDRWLGFFHTWADTLRKSRVPTILGGDFNIAHTERDIFHAKSNQKTSGFLPHEREWMGSFIDMGWHDIVREEFGDIDGPYSWWSNRGRARELDRGWRIDYLFLNPAARKVLKGCHIDRESGLGVSDHAMVICDLDV